MNYPWNPQDNYDQHISYLVESVNQQNASESGYFNALKIKNCVGISAYNYNQISSKSD